jgi:ribonuclease E
LLDRSAAASRGRERVAETTFTSGSIGAVPLGTGHEFPFGAAPVASSGPTQGSRAALLLGARESERQKPEMLEDEPTEQPSETQTSSAAAPAKPARRRRAAGRPAGPPVEAAADQPASAADEPPPADEQPAQAPAPRARRTRKRAEAPADAPDAPALTTTAEEPAPEAPPTRARRSRSRAAEKPAEPVEATDAATEEESDEAAATSGPPAPTVLFQAPTISTPRRSRRAGSAVGEPTAVEEAADQAEAPAGPTRQRRRSRSAQAESVAGDVAKAAAETAEAEDDSTDDAEDHEGSESGPRRRRRRGGRGRRGRGGAGDSGTESEEDSGDTAAEAEESGDDSGEDSGDDAGDGTGSRRRRRRRRRGEDGPTAADDPEKTVTRVRSTRTARSSGGSGGSSSDNEVTAVRGSTRLEAKKQRRREGREAGRRRAPILSEAEFLARREAVDRVMVIRQGRERTQIAVLEDGVLVEHYVNKVSSSSLMGDIFLGRVQNVLPSMEAAFVDIGKGRNAVLYAGEVNFEGLEGQPKRIEHVLKSGQSVLVQATKDPIGHKGARLTSQISLPGRYLVYVPENSMTGISRKLPDTERNRLKSILRQVLPEDAGVIVRTAAEGASEDELRHDVERLAAQWEQVQAKAKTANAPALLLGEPDLMIRVVRDVFNEDFGSLVVSGDEAWAEISDYVGRVAPDLAPRLTRWVEPTDVFAAHRVDEQILKALDRKVWLPSGGSLVIDRTEAMTVVDVNTGKFTGSGGNLEETVTRNNLEAAEEIVRQLRLRDIGGIIVVDFIDMVLESNRELVLRRMVECLGRDRTKHQVAEVTSLGLVQMTRKRIGQGLLEAFSEPCEHCSGRGIMVRTDDPKAKSPKPAPPSGNGNGRNGHAAESDADESGESTGEPATRSSSRGGRRRGRGGGDPSAPGSVTASPDDPDAAAVEPAVVHQRDVTDNKPQAESEAETEEVRPARRSRRRRADSAAAVEASV